MAQAQRLTEEQARAIVVRDHVPVIEQLLAPESRTESEWHTKLLMGILQQLFQDLTPSQEREVSQRIDELERDEVLMTGSRESINNVLYLLIVMTRLIKEKPSVETSSSEA